jgi:hypothetical protein
LYFYAPPNKDSLKPVVDYIKKDVFHLVETLKWTQPAVQNSSSNVMASPEEPKKRPGIVEGEIVGDKSKD